MYYKPNICQTYNIKRLTIMIMFNVNRNYSVPKKPYVGADGRGVDKK